jgi:phospholipid/cholesterol/gamma-HCH transport system substrate-binding protein
LQGKLETKVGIFVLIALGIFVYMGFQIGAFRFDRHKYDAYTMYFDDISGLSRKADVKIAGVKVGWVEDIKLIPDHDLKAEAKIMVLKDYTLYTNAHAVVRQEGLLGPKYLELVPGDPLLAELKAGGTLGRPGISPVSMDELLQKFKSISHNVEDVTDSVKEVFGGEAGKEQLRAIFDNLNVTAEKMASFSDVVERTVVRNEDNIDVILGLGQDIRRIAEKIEMEVLPSVKDGIDRISSVFDRDFDKVSSKLTETADALEEASLQARDGFASINSVANKIDEGKGLLGKLVNEDETYKDLKVAVSGLKNYFSQVDKLQLIFDGHSETMHRPAEHYHREDNKFYFDVRIHPDEDYFYLVGICSSLKGWVDRYEIRKSYLDHKDEKVNPECLVIDDETRLRDVFTEKRHLITRNTIKMDLQFGKIFKDIAFRVGLFEGCGGVGVDFDIPFRSEKFRWVTTFEAFDMVGWNRIDDPRPHLKWLNRMYFMRNIYFTFGADDFVSKENANAFVGFGMRFGDDNAKYLLQSVGGAGGISYPGYVLAIR